MGERRLLDAVTERLTLSRRMRILRHRTARWFLPPVRQTVDRAPRRAAALAACCRPRRVAPRHSDVQSESRPRRSDSLHAVSTTARVGSAVARATAWA